MPIACSIGQYLDKPFTLHICMDGTVTYRHISEPIFNSAALPFYSVNTAEQAQQLIVLLCKLHVQVHPMLPNQPWYYYSAFKGTLEDIERVAIDFRIRDSEFPLNNHS